MKQKYIGRVIKKSKYFVLPFIFNVKKQLIPVEFARILLENNDIVEYTYNNENSSAIVIRILAHNGSAFEELFKIIERNRITLPYPEKVIEETEKILENPCIDKEDLKDLTNLPFITIDNEDSRDLDQALYISRDSKYYKIYYALADAGFYIKPGMALFKEALERGSTFYMPGFSVPMLPPELSEGIFSLNPDVDRRAFVFIMDMNMEGNIQSSKCIQARIHSRAKLSYNGVQEFYNNPLKSLLLNKEYTSCLKLLKTVGEIRIKAARKNNRVHFNRVESYISCSKDGKDFIFNLDKRNDCSRYNEQISLMCNMVGARFLVSGNDPHIQGIYKIHESPDNEELEELSNTIKIILISHNIDDKKYFWNRKSETLADYIDRLHEIKINDRLLESLERQVLISMRRSMFANKAGEHFALATNPYSRFSSPMREIVGIFIHKEALEKINTKYCNSIEEDNIIREKVILAGNRAKEKQKIIERQILEAAIDRLFSLQLKIPIEKRRKYNATILGIKKTRLYVRLDIPFIELKVYTEDLQQESGNELVYKNNLLINKKSGKVEYKPGDEITLFVQSYRKNRWRLINQI